MGKCNFRVSVNLILKKENQVCLMRRYNTGWNDGMYALMGGHVEDNEKPTKAIIREAKEELGIDINEDDLKQVFTMAVNPDHIYLYFLCEKYIGEVINNEPNECDDVRFFDVDNLPENIIGADKTAMEEIFKSDNKYFEYNYKD